jgi:hypothetical protein
LIKLYDKDTREFKLNDVSTFIGVLEFNEVAQDSQMSDPEKEELPAGVPNEDKLPKLHVITYRRNYV